MQSRSEYIWIICLQPLHGLLDDISSLPTFLAKRVTHVNWGVPRLITHEMSAGVGLEPCFGGRSLHALLRSPRSREGAQLALLWTLRWIRLYCMRAFCSFRSDDARWPPDVTSAVAISWADLVRMRLPLSGNPLYDVKDVGAFYEVEVEAELLKPVSVVGTENVATAYFRTLRIWAKSEASALSVAQDAIVQDDARVSDYRRIQEICPFALLQPPNEGALDWERDNCYQKLGRTYFSD